VQPGGKQLFYQTLKVSETLRVYYLIANQLYICLLYLYRSNYELIKNKFVNYCSNVEEAAFSDSLFL